MTAPAPTTDQITDAVAIETGRIEGCLRVISELSGFTAADRAAKRALERVYRSAPKQQLQDWMGDR